VSSELIFGEFSEFLVTNFKKEKFKGVDQVILKSFQIEKKVKTARNDDGVEFFR